jgi:hypothetical protein
VNVEKAKMMVFNNNKRKRKREENEWKWEGSEFKYLGYTFNERATDKAHKREIVMIDGIEKRKEEEEENDDVWERIDVRAEIWGWREQEEVKRVPVREECKRNRLRVKAGKGAESLKTKWMEEKSAEYWENTGKKRKRTRRRKGERSTTKGTGMPVKKWKHWEQKEELMNVELSERDKDTDKQERRERIKESRYNREYERHGKIQM